MPPADGVLDASASAAPPGLPEKGNCIWTRPDGKSLLVYLVDNVAEAGDGGNFKAKTFRGAAAVVEKLRTKGGPKTGKACANKYAAVSNPCRHAAAPKLISRAFLVQKNIWCDHG